MTNAETADVRMYQHERQQLILDRARQRSRVEVAGLAEELEVTTETIRRDLSALERRGLLRRVHGGAVLVERLTFEPTVAAREIRLSKEKDRMGLAALSWIPEGGSILLDGGTSVLALVRQLPEDLELSVVTNSLPAAAILARLPQVELHLLGGRVRSRTQVSVGTWSAGVLAGICVDVAFIGTNGLTLQHGLTTPDLAEAESKRAMIGAARQVVTLADHSKFGASYFGRFAELAEIDVLITDDELDEEDVAEIEERGPQVVRA